MKIVLCFVTVIYFERKFTGTDFPTATTILILGHLIHMVWSAGATRTPRTNRKNGEKIEWNQFVQFTQSAADCVEILGRKTRMGILKLGILKPVDWIDGIAVDFSRSNRANSDKNSKLELVERVTKAIGAKYCWVRFGEHKALMRFRGSLSVHGGSIASLNSSNSTKLMREKTYLDVSKNVWHTRWYDKSDQHHSEIPHFWWLEM